MFPTQHQCRAVVVRDVLVQRRIQAEDERNRAGQNYTVARRDYNNLVDVDLQDFDMDADCAALERVNEARAALRDAEELYTRADKDLQEVVLLIRDN